MNKIKYKAPYELKKGYKSDSGVDVKIWSIDLIDEKLKGKKWVDPYIILPNQTIHAQTGVYLELPEDYECQVRPKSGISKQGILVHFGTVDSGFRGEITVAVTNVTNNAIELESRQKIAQLVIKKKDPVELIRADEINLDTDRGAKGYGSTGKF